MRYYGWQVSRKLLKVKLFNRKNYGKTPYFQQIDKPNNGSFQQCFCRAEEVKSELIMLAIRKTTNNNKHRINNFLTTKL